MKKVHTSKIFLNENELISTKLSFTCGKKKTRGKLYYKFVRDKTRNKNFLYGHMGSYSDFEDLLVWLMTVREPVNSDEVWNQQLIFFYREETVIINIHRSFVIKIHIDVDINK